MNARQRYLATVNRQPADRPPFDLLGTACGLTDGTFARLKSLLGVPGPDRCFRKGQNVGLYNPELLDALEVDARRVWLRQLTETEPPATGGRFADDWGIEHEKCGNHFQQVGWPLRDAGLSEIERYAVPHIRDPRRVEGLREEAAKLRQEGRSAVVGRSATMGFFEVGCALRGMELYLMDMIERPEIIEALNEKILGLQMELYGLYLDACGEFLDVIETADDYGGGTGPLVSPACFRRLLKPYRLRLNEFIRKKAPHIRIFHHTCGNVRLLIPDLVEIGVDILNPVQPVPGMEPKRLAREFGRDICFHGAVDTISVMRGSVAEVAQAARKLCADFSGASWIVAPANHLQDDVPAENIVAFYQTVKECFRK
jgi:uroporphyrinogen decarboxylase